MISNKENLTKLNPAERQRSAFSRRLTHIHVEVGVLRILMYITKILMKSNKKNQNEHNRDTHTIKTLMIYTITEFI